MNARSDAAFIPSVGTTELAWLLAPLVPAERKAMAEIADNADVLNVNGEGWLLVPVTSQEMLDTLAAFGVEGEDCENDLEDEEETDLGAGIDEGSVGGRPTHRARPSAGVVVPELK